jgi:hypothetical protein
LDRRTEIKISGKSGQKIRFNFGSYWGNCDIRADFLVKAFDILPILWQVAQTVDKTKSFKGDNYAQRRMGCETRLPNNRQAFL